jgi:hypothetical protein
LYKCPLWRSDLKTEVWLYTKLPYRSCYTSKHNQTFWRIFLVNFSKSNYNWLLCSVKQKQNLSPEVIKPFPPVRVRPACPSVQFDLALYCWNNSYNLFSNIKTTWNRSITTVNHNINSTSYYSLTDWKFLINYILFRIN